MSFTKTTGIVIVIMIIMTIIIRLIIDKIISGKLEQYLLMKDYERLEKVLDSFLCKVTYTPFRREMLRLNGYSMQENVAKVDKQFSFMFNNMRLSQEQEINLNQRGFYYYMERKEYKKAEIMLKRLEKLSANHASIKIMNIMYDILACKKSKYIDILKLAIKNTENIQDKSLGIIEYLIALQYSYVHDIENMQIYLKRAKLNCKDTAYEKEINKLLDLK